MAQSSYAKAIRVVKRQAKTARQARVLAYHLDTGLHGEASPAETPGWWRWYPHPAHRGWLVEAAALVVAPSR